MCWLKSSVPARVQDNCCVSGVRGAGVVEPRNSAVETSIDRAGGDYRSFELKGGEGDEACKAACAADNKCRAWTYARAGYAGKERALLPEKGDQAAAPQGRGLSPAWCGNSRRRASRADVRIVIVASGAETHDACSDMHHAAHRDFRPQLFQRLAFAA